MRLLNTTTLEFKEFWSSNFPEYAILSHTWGENEVTFDDLRTRNAKKKAGFAKLRGFCALAKDDNFDYVWMDTCCIDKSSSTELSEAINSMYRWYEKSTICYAYLEDVRDDDDIKMENSNFRHSRWFTRGWTLQELIAPSYICFYSASWKILGKKLLGFNSVTDRRYRRLSESKVVPNLCELLSTITGISPGILRKSSMLGDCSAATRMSWAASRQTSRSEDIAYCLMGIFDVNMPLLYGEGGERAFDRLQQEILRVTQDDTLLMHICPENYCHHNSCHPPLASSPKAFRGLGAVERGEKGPLFNGRNIPSQMTPNGLQVQLPLCPCEFQDSGSNMHERAYIAILDCILPGFCLDRGVIVLQKLPNGAFSRYPNTLISRLEFDKQEVAVRMNGDIICKATAIEINHLQLMDIHISDYTFNNVFRELYVNHWGLTFQGIEQPPGFNIVLHGETESYQLRRQFIAKQFKLCFLLDETNGDNFFIILGAHNILDRRAGHHSVPYCKISILNPKQVLEDTIRHEHIERMYPDRDPDNIQEQNGSQPSPFSQPPSPQRATLELTGSRTAVVSVSTIRFLEREEHRFKLTITEKI